MKRLGMGLVLAAVAGVVVLVVWLSMHDANAIRTDLRIVVPKMLELTLLLLVAGAVANFRGMRDSLPGGFAVLAALFAAALLLVTFLPPQTHRIFYDEDIYENIGQNILWNGRAQMCNEGTIAAGVFECQAWEYNKEPNAFPFLLSMVYRLTGVEEAWSHRLNHALFALGVLAIYWSAMLLFERRSVALAAAVVYMLTPENLIWGATVAAEPGASALGALGVAAWVHFCRTPSYRAAAFAAACLALATQFRPESGLVLAVAGAATLFLRPRLFLRRELAFAVVLGFVLLIPHFAHMWSVRQESWGSQEAKFALTYVSGNLAANTRYYFEGHEFPPLFTLFALLGVFGLVWTRRRAETFVVTAWFVLMFGIFIPFYAGSYRFGADIRFSVVSAAPLALLAGLGIGRVGEWLRRLGPSPWLERLPLLVAVYAFSSYLPLVTSVGREAWQARDDHAAIERMLEAIPEDSMFLTHNPGLVHVLGRSATQASVVTYQPVAADRYFDRFPGGVYFQFGFWCNVPDPIQNKMCTDVLMRYPTRVVQEESSGFYRYILYRLLPRPAEESSTPTELTKP